MDKYIEILKQQLNTLESRLNKTTNPIEWIRLDAQLVLLSDCLRLANQIKAQEKVAEAPADSKA